MKQNVMKRKYTLIALVAVALFACVAIALSSPATAFAAESKFDEAVYRNVGVVKDSNKIPAFLKASEEAPAKAEERMKLAYKEMTEAGFDMGAICTDEAGGGIREWQNFAVQEFRGGDQKANLWGREHGYIICGTVADGIGAGCIVNNMMLRWTENTGTWGYPIGNQFTLGTGSKIYQNFINGYATLSGNTATFKESKFLNKETGKEEATPVAAVEVGRTSGEMPAWAEGKSEQIKKAFADAVEKIENTDAVKEGGFDMGAAFDTATLWMPENLAVTQPFTGGDHSGNPYGWRTQGRLMLSDADAAAFPLLGANLTRWAALNGFRGVGYPLSYPFKMGDSEYQIFSKAYFVTDELGYIENVRLYAGVMNFADKSSVPAEAGAALAQSNFMEVYKNHNNTGANFGIPDDYMKFASGAFTQSFTAPNGTTNYLVQKSGDAPCVKVTGAAAKTFGELGIGVTGTPRANAFTVGEGVYQNFAKGYVKPDGSWVAGKNISPDGNEVKAGAFVPHADTGVLGEGVTSYSSSVKDEFITKVLELNELGTYCYEPAGKVREEEGCAVQEFVNTASASKGRMALVKTSRSSPVYVISDVFYNLYEQMNGFRGVMPPPAGDRFFFGGRIYQNFKTGYATVDSSNTVSLVFGQNVSADGVYTDVGTGAEISPVPDDVGKFGDINRIPINMRNSEEQIRAAFVAEYARLMKEGFYPGETDNELVHQWAPQPSYSWINQTFKNGDSTAEAFGNNSAMKMFMTDIEKGAFSVYSEMLAAWMKLGNLNSVGYPEGNQFVYNGDLYQNFTNGYVRCPNGMSTSAEFVMGETFEIPAPSAEKTAGCGSSVAGEASGLFAISLIALCFAAAIAVRGKKEA